MKHKEIDCSIEIIAKHACPEYPYEPAQRACLSLFDDDSDDDNYNEGECCTHQCYLRAERGMRFRINCDFGFMTLRPQLLTLKIDGSIVAEVEVESKHFGRIDITSVFRSGGDTQCFAQDFVFGSIKSELGASEMAPTRPDTSTSATQSMIEVAVTMAEKQEPSYMQRLLRPSVVTANNTGFSSHTPKFADTFVSFGDQKKALNASDFERFVPIGSPYVTFIYHYRSQSKNFATEADQEEN